MVCPPVCVTRQVTLRASSAPPVAKRSSYRHRLPATGAPGSAPAVKGARAFPASSMEAVSSARRRASVVAGEGPGVGAGLKGGRQISTRRLRAGSWLTGICSPRDSMVNVIPALAPERPESISARNASATLFARCRAMASLYASVPSWLA